jgi:hypothetical protein
MDHQALSDRAEIVDLVSKYNKASFYCDVKGYADTFTDDGRYINANHGWVGFGGPEASDAIAAEYRQGTGLQHLCLDYLIEFVEPNKALVRHHMLMFQREGAHNPNQISNTGFYYRTVVRTPEGWRFSEIVSFVDRKMSDELVTNLRGLVLSRPVILTSLSTLLEMGGDAILDAVRTGRSLVSLKSGQVSEAKVIDTVAAAFQTCAPSSNPLPRGTARALAYVLTHDQVYGAEVENNFRAAGWEGPPTKVQL